VVPKFGSSHWSRLCGTTTCRPRRAGSALPSKQNTTLIPAKTPAKLLVKSSCQIFIVKSLRFRYDVHAGWSSLVARWAHNPRKCLPALSPHQLSFTVFSGFPSCFSQSVRQLLHESDHVRLEVTLARPSQLSNAQSPCSPCPARAGLIGEPHPELRRGAISCGNQDQNTVRSCHKKNSGAAIVCLSLSSAKPRQRPQPGRIHPIPELITDQLENSQSGES